MALSLTGPHLAKYPYCIVAKTQELTFVKKLTGDSGEGEVHHGKWHGDVAIKVCGNGIVRWALWVSHVCEIGCHVCARDVCGE